MAFIKDMSVRRKISAGFMAVLLLLLLTTVASYVRFGSVSTGFDTYAQRVGVVNISRDIERTFLDMRRHVREFALTGNPEDAKAALVDADGVSVSITRGVAEIHHPDRHRMILELQAGFEAYRSGMERVLRLKRELDALTVGDLDRTGAETRAIADALVATLRAAGPAEAPALAEAGLESLMDLRLAANKMLGRHDASLVQAADRSAGSLAGAMTRLHGMMQGRPEQATVERLQASAAGYVAAFHHARDLTSQLGELVNGDMLRNAQLIARASESVVGSALAEEQAIALETHGAIRGTERLLLVLAIGGLALGVTAAALIGRGISRPISAMAGAMRALAAGNLETEIPGQGRRDELGQMAEALMVFRQSAREERRLQEAAAAEGAGKERRQAAMDRHTQDFGATISGVMLRLVHSAEAMRDAATSTSAASERTHASAAQTAVGASESSRNLSSISAATEQMSASINGITAQVREAAQDSSVAAEKAAATDAKVSTLARAAEKIDKVVQIIMGIAGQTNLLALNATIEAARAGEAGKGFAVVAGAVKTLAEQTAAATTEIESEIGAIRGATIDAVTAVQDMSLAIGRVNGVAREIAVAVEQQGAATHEIAVSVQAVNATTQETSASMQEVSAIAENAGAATREVKNTADEIGQIAATLHQEVSHFLLAMGSCSEQNRRRYERRPGEGLRVSLAAAGLGRTDAELIDISRGGAGCECALQAEPGTDVAVYFAGIAMPVPARVVRCHDGKAALSFVQSAAALDIVDEVLGRLERHAA